MINYEYNGLKIVITRNGVTINYDYKLKRALKITNREAKYRTHWISQFAS